MEFGYYLDGRSKNEIWPDLMPMNELKAKTAQIFSEYLNSGTEIVNRDDLVSGLFKLQGGAALDANACTFNADYFSKEVYPEIADPYMAFQWEGYSYAIMENMGASQVSLWLNLMTCAHCLMLFGNIDQRVNCIQLLEIITEMFCKPELSDYWSVVYKHICFMAGVHPIEVFRSDKYDFPEVNKEIAVAWYKKCRFVNDFGR